MLYFFGVFSPLPARVKSLERQGMSTAQIFDLIDQDSGEEFAHGQTVRDTFPEADFFLRIDADTDTQIKARVERFLHIILGTKLTTPANSETAMYLAASAAGNSACLSRQVGATLTDAEEEVIAIGWNDVPKFGGNLYVFMSSTRKVTPLARRTSVAGT
jgi:deoxycytidylate deaminase